MHSMHFENSLMSTIYLLCVNNEQTGNKTMFLHFFKFMKCAVKSNPLFLDTERTSNCLESDRYAKRLNYPYLKKIVLFVLVLCFMIK